jgi:undecaprenyl diphosphate synthase
MTEPPLDPRGELGLSPEQLPRHIAIIMDGNGRWAARQNLPRILGHERGAQSVRTIVTHCARLGIEALTLYSFSTDNWKRPRAEVEHLMALYVRYLIGERETLRANNVRLLHIGRREGLPAEVLAEMDRTIEASRRHTGLTLCVAINYGSRDEIVDAVRDLARQVRAGRLDPERIDEGTIHSALYTAGVPDPDLLIRTANERRLSNFLLWQISYAEIHVCEKLWPDFGSADLNAAIRDFAGRDRRYGGVAAPRPAKTTEPEPRPRIHAP